MDAPDQLLLSEGVCRQLGNGAMVVMVREVSGVELVEDREKGKKGGQTLGVVVEEGIGGCDSNLSPKRGAT